MSKVESNFRQKNNLKQKYFDINQKEMGFMKRAFYLKQTDIDKINQVKKMHSLDNQHEALRYIIESFNLDPK